MKPILPWLGIALFYGWGAALLVRMALPESPPTTVIHQHSRHAVLRIDDPDLADAILNGTIRIEADHPDATTILQVDSGRPSVLRGKLSPSGRLLVINPAGVIVETPPAGTQPVGPLMADRKGDSSVELVAHGNVYALAIRDGSVVRATGSSLRGGRVLLTPPPPGKSE